MSLRDALRGVKVGRRLRPLSRSPRCRGGRASHPMQLVTCNDAPKWSAGQETFDSAGVAPSIPGKRPGGLLTLPRCTRLSEAALLGSDGVRPRPRAALTVRRDS